MADERKEKARPTRRAKKVAATPEVAGEAEAAHGVRPRAPRPDRCRRFARTQMAKAMPELVGTLVERSAEGSLGHMRLLVQLSGLDETEPAKRRHGKSVVRTLLEDWRSAGDGK